MDEEIRHTEVIGSPGVKEGLVRMNTVTARDLTEAHIGRFIGCNRDGVNYQAKILKLTVHEGGRAPGVSMVLRHPVLPSSGQWDESVHVPFDLEIELIELTAM